MSKQARSNANNRSNQLNPNNAAYWSGRGAARPPGASPGPAPPGTEPKPAEQPPTPPPAQPPEKP